VVLDVLSRVTVLGAVCELDGVRGRLRYRLSQFVDLEDGRRVVWSDDRSFGGMPTAEDPAMQRRVRDALPNALNFRSGRHLVREALLVLDEDHPYDYPDVVLAGLQRIGMDVDPISVYAAPFRIEFGPALQAQLPQIVEQSWRHSPPPGRHLWQKPD